MTGASIQKSGAEQLATYRVSTAAHHKSMCARCGGLMVNDFCMDVLNSIGESRFDAKRCVQCGEVVDPVILENRRTIHTPMGAPLVGTYCQAIRDETR